MKLKKGDQVRTDDGLIGEILFVDRDGVEAQVALDRVSIKLHTETLEKVEAGARATGASAAAVKPKAPKKRSTKAN